MTLAGARLARHTRLPTAMRVPGVSRGVRDRRRGHPDDVRLREQLEHAVDLRLRELRPDADARDPATGQHATPPETP
jgi:hypothetical protein